jgi:hypothetical protein
MSQVSIRLKIMTKRECKTWSLERIETMRKAGIKWVKILGTGNEGDDCKDCIALRGLSIPIEAAPTLPLRGCNKKVCKCVIVASDAKG